MTHKCWGRYLCNHGPSAKVLRAVYLPYCCRVLSDGQDNAPAPVIGALPDPHKPPRP